MGNLAEIVNEAEASLHAGNRLLSSQKLTEALREFTSARDELEEVLSNLSESYIVNVVIGDAFSLMGTALVSIAMLKRGHTCSFFLEGAVKDYERAISAYNAALILPLKQIEKERTKISSAVDERIMSSYIREVVLSRKSYAMKRFSIVLGELGKAEDAQQYWNLAKRTYLEVLSGEHIVPEVFDATIELGDMYSREYAMYFRSDEFDSASKLFRQVIKHPWAPDWAVERASRNLQALEIAHSRRN